MPSSKTFLTLFFLAIFVGCATAPTKVERIVKEFDDENRLIVLALEAERVRDFKSSSKFLKTLYKKTNKIEYKIKELNSLIEQKRYAELEKSAREILKNENLTELELTNIYKFLLIKDIKTKEYKKAITNAKNVLKHENSRANYETIYSIFLIQKDYENAIKYLNIAYEVEPQKYLIDKKISTLFIYLSDILNKKTDKSLDDLLKLSLESLKEHKVAKMYELIYNIYLLKKDYENAVIYAESAYAKSHSEEALDKLTSTMYIYLGDKSRAISYLETHSRIYGCSELLCNRLVSLYAEKQNIDGIISVYKKMYREINKIEYGKKVVELFIFQKKFPPAIAFLEKNRFDEALLLDIYKLNKDFEKAQSLADKLYSDTNDLNYLAQSAMLEYEIGLEDNDLSNIDSVVKKLKYINSVMSNDIYQNYLGYILIEHDMDLKNGIELIKKALEKSPDSPYYLDSLAWGYYKLKKCKKAYETMQRVIDLMGLKEQEVREHWSKIKKCQKGSR